MKSQAGYTPLLRALDSKQPKTEPFLTGKGANVHTLYRWVQKISPYRRVSSFDATDTIQLLERGVEDTAGNSGKTAEQYVYHGCFTSA